MAFLPFHVHRHQRLRRAGDGLLEPLEISLGGDLSLPFNPSGCLEEVRPFVKPDEWLVENYGPAGKRIVPGSEKQQ